MCSKLIRIRISEPYITHEEINAIVNVLKSGRLSMGEIVRRFEEEFARYIGVRHAIATSSGTTALYAALYALKLRDCEVVTTAFSFIASANAILYVGCKPIFADIDPRTFNIDPEDILNKITNRTKAVLIVHLFGQPCDMKSIMEIVRDYNLTLIEDACQAHGAEYNGVKVGSFGDVAVFSFYATKNITTGEGGMVVTNNDDIARRVRLFINQGQDRKYHHVILGFNFRMTEIQGALGIQQLKKLEYLNNRRIQNARYLTNGLRRLSTIETPYELPNVKHVYHQYVIKADNRDELMKYLINKGVEARIHYPLPIYKQPLYVKLGYGGIRLHNTEEVVKRVLSLPVHPKLDKDELNMIISEIYRFYREE